MRSRDITDLLVLAAIWGGSFLFMRMAVPELGPAPMMVLRVGLAALVLAPLAILRGSLPIVAKRWKQIFFVGAFNAALPFILYAYAAQQLGAGFLSITNAVTPMFGAILGWVWLGDRLAPSRIVGLVVGFAGIVVLVWDKFGLGADATRWATAAALTAPICYAIAANCTKRYLTGVDALTNAAGCMVSATILLLPFAIWTWPEQAVSVRAWTATVLLALLCTALAYTLFFRLIASVGPTAAVSVTFLVPVFGVFWGAFLLDEEITATIVAGAAIIFAGTALSLGLIGMPRATRKP